MAKLIGKSLSYCVKDIAEGKVDINDVIRIDCSVRCYTFADWVHVIRTYVTNHVWDNDVCLMVFEALLRDDKIRTRPLFMDYVNVSGGHWTVAEF